MKNPFSHRPVSLSDIICPVLCVAIPLLTGACNSIDSQGIKGKIEVLSDLEFENVENRPVRVWMPDNYPEDAPYAVIYMHDGQMLFDGASTWNGQEWGVDEVLSKLISEHRIQPAIVVAIDNAGLNRRSEYTPQKAFEFLSAAARDSLYRLPRSPNEAMFGAAVYSDRYLKFIFSELKPYIDEHYHTDASRETTFMIGSSMGGLISLYAMLEYPELLGGVACLSTHWIITYDDNRQLPAVILKYMDKTIPKPGNNYWYFDHGTEGLDRYYSPHQQRVDSLFSARLDSGEYWQSRVYQGAGHNENSWHIRLHEPLEFLLGRN